MKDNENNKQLTFKVVVERDKCTSCGTCIDACPELFELDEDSISHVIGSERIGMNDELNMKEVGCSLDGAESCPVLCIHVYDDDNNELI